MSRYSYCDLGVHKPKAHSALIEYRGAFATVANALSFYFSEKVDRSKFANCASFPQAVKPVQHSPGIASAKASIESRHYLGALKRSRPRINAGAPTTNPEVCSSHTGCLAPALFFRSELSWDKHFVQNAPWQGLRPNSLSVLYGPTKEAAEKSLVLLNLLPFWFIF